jgi:hypothetical protein
MNDFQKQFDRYEAESRARRLKYPKWPSHKTETYMPGVGTDMHETMPVGRTKGYRAYCKYCYTVHSNWWAMDALEAIAGTPVLLCGRCEYTSLREES